VLGVAVGGLVPVVVVGGFVSVLPASPTGFVGVVETMLVFVGVDEVAAGGLEDEAARGPVPGWPACVGGRTPACGVWTRLPIPL
jgi:hypothetical protein